MFIFPFLVGGKALKEDAVLGWTDTRWKRFTLFSFLSIYFFKL